MPEYLFSYGTLQPGLAPAEIEPIVQKFRYLGKAYIYGLLYDFGDYPGVLLGQTESKVWGQILEIPADPDLLRRLDEYEEFDPSNIESSQFVRKKHVAILEDGKIM